MQEQRSEAHFSFYLFLPDKSQKRQRGKKFFIVFPKNSCNFVYAIV